MADPDLLPLADLNREKMAARLFPEYRTMSPEEWAARFSHQVICSDFDSYRYRDPVLHEWIQKLHGILLEGSAQIDSYRRQYLSEEERLRIEKDGKEYF
jgi:hypothetical protein